jgi:hypothetical protein
MMGKVHRLSKDNFVTVLVIPLIKKVDIHCMLPRSVPFIPSVILEMVMPEVLGLGQSGLYSFYFLAELANLRLY